MSSNRYNNEVLRRFDEIGKGKNVLDATLEYFKEPAHLDVDTSGSDIVRFYSGKHIFVTGGTGFVGLLTVEKLLRASPDLGRIYLLIRSKKGKDVQTRIRNYFEDAVFSEMKRFCPNYLEKVVPIVGDVALLGLGITDEDRRLLIDNVNIIIHGAATVRFDQHIKNAVQTNVRGTKETLELGKQCKKLVSFVYIGTAYSNCIQKKIKEEITEYAAKPEDVMQLVERCSSEELAERTPELIGKFPNTYSFTKCISENVLKDYMNDVPIVLFRPSIIGQTYREPLKGWLNNLYGPAVFAFATGMGLQHIFLTDLKKRIDLVPADYVVNGLLAVCYKTSKERGKVYNFVTRPCVQMDYRQYIDLIPKLSKNFSGSTALWRAFIFKVTANRSVFLILGFFFHYIPAVIFTVLAKITGTKLTIDLIDAVRKLHSASQLLSFFGVNEWCFDYENVDNLWDELSESDKNVYPFDVREINWTIFGGIAACGLRQYITKEEIATIPEGRKRQKLFKKLNYVVFALVWIGLFLVANKIYNSIFL